MAGAVTWWHELVLATAIAFSVLVSTGHTKKSTTQHLRPKLLLPLRVYLRGLTEPRCPECGERI
jgi:hypothetical protein